MKDFIDIIITTHNRPQFIAEAVESVVYQTYKFIRIIIIDDGSESAVENQTSIKKFFQRARLILRGNTLISAENNKLTADKTILFYYIYQKNSGISQARNTGIKLSKSNYLAFLDDDDLWEKTKLQKQFDVLKEEKYSACYTNEKWLRNGQHLNQCKKHKKYSGYIFEYALPLCIISASSILLKKNIIEKIGLFDTNFIVCEDYEYWLRLTLNYEIFFIDEPLIIKRGGHQNQLSKKFQAMDKYRVAALLKLISEQKLPAAQFEKAIAELLKKSAILFNGCLKRGKQNESEFYRYIIEKNKNIHGISKDWKSIICN